MSPNTTSSSWCWPAFTGARRAQLLGLRWDNVSLAEERVAFRAGWVEGPNGPVLADTKTKQSHVVDLDPGTCGILAGYADAVEEPVGEGYVFSDDGGATAWKPNRVTKTFGRYRRAVGLRSFRLHDLRHFMATEMLVFADGAAHPEFGLRPNVAET